MANRNSLKVGKNIRYSFQDKVLRNILWKITKLLESGAYGENYLYNPEKSTLTLYLNSERCSDSNSALGVSANYTNNHCGFTLFGCGSQLLSNSKFFY